MDGQGPVSMITFVWLQKGTRESIKSASVHAEETKITIQGKLPFSQQVQYVRCSPSFLYIREEPLNQTYLQ